MEKWTEPKCAICNKEYKSKKSLWNHNKKYHEPDISHKPTDDKPNISQKQLISDKEIKISYSCSICNKDYKHFQSRWKHEQKCKKVEKEKEKEHEFNELKNKMKIEKKHIIAGSLAILSVSAAIIYLQYKNTAKCL